MEKKLILISILLFFVYQNKSAEVAEEETEKKLAQADIISNSEKMSFLRSQDEELKKIHNKTEQIENDKQFEVDFVKRFEKILATKNWDEALICAAKYGYLEGVRGLLWRKDFVAEVLSKALNAAIAFGHHEINTLLRRYGAKPMIIQSVQRRPVKTHN